MSESQNLSGLAQSFIRPQWSAPENIVALTTTRLGGVSLNDYASFNLADHAGDERDRVAINRRLLTQSLGNSPSLQWLRQNHGSQVIEAVNPGAVYEADASYSREPQIACCVLTADCLPVLLTTSDGDVVAAVHAGWRGLVAGVLENTLQAMNANADKILVWLGPAIGSCHFEVGAEVRSAFLDAVEPDQRQSFDQLAFTVQANSKYLADLYAIARYKLQQQGVERIYGGGFCTYCNDQQFYSYRRQPVTGRMANLIYIRS